MTPILSLLGGSAYLELPRSLFDWLGWVFLLLLIVGFPWRGQVKSIKSKGGSIRWGPLALFLLLVPLTNLFLGLRISSEGALPPAGIPAGPHPPAWMIFSALPWMLAGGFLGPLAGLAAGALTGLVRGLWDTHSLFSLLEPALLAWLFGAAVQQRYHGRGYGLLRQPLFVSLTLTLVYGIVFLYGSLFSAAGGLAARLDFSLTNLGPAILAAAGELLGMGLFVQIIAMAWPRAWGRKEDLLPSPAELSFQTRLLSGGGIFIAILLASVILGDWIAAGNAARRMIRERMAETAQAAASQAPYFLEAGQNLITQMAARPEMLKDTGEDLSQFLGGQMRLVPFFDRLYVLDLQGKLLTAYPSSEAASFGLSTDESHGLALAADGVSIQRYSLAPLAGETTARLSYITAIPDETGTAVRILIGRCPLGANPLAGSFLQSLRGLASWGGEARLLDEQGRVLAGPFPDELMSAYPVERGGPARSYDVPAPNGTRSLAYYQPIEGTPWSLMLLVPARQTQQLALQIAGPLLIVVALLGVAAVVSLRLSLRPLTASLQGLAAEAGRIARGQLDQPLEETGTDEVGQLRQAFEQMRLSMQARLEELNQLLLVSQGVASTLDIADAVQPILEAVLASGASAVRLALAASAGPQEGTPLHLALGPSRDQYAWLDEPLLREVQNAGRLVHDQQHTWNRLEENPRWPRPQALAAVSLSHERRYYGTLWAAFDQTHTFSEEELRFLSTLAAQAALAAANARLFRSAEVGRQRLAAILTSSPDPMLVTDQDNRLILANPAAKRALGVVASGAEGQPTERVIGQQELRELLHEFEGEKKSAEVVMPDGKVYFATASAVMADGRPVGRVCVMQDVTHFKELDSLKSDFVSSVSHDLRSPLTLIRGYTTMLGMVGDLNEQQQGYVGKIVVGVESMAHLVSNLLDLGRIGAGTGLHLEKIDPQELVGAVTKSLQPLAEQKAIIMEVQALPGIPLVVEADRALLQQALTNLVENAIKYTPKEGRLTVRIKSLPESVLFEVQDTGIGISPADQPRLFEKFFRGTSREARAERGSGLGLAIVRSIAERHGGKVWAESALGKGSTFFLLIPSKA